MGHLRIVFLLRIGDIFLVLFVWNNFRFYFGHWMLHCGVWGYCYNLLENTDAFVWAGSQLSYVQIVICVLISVSSDLILSSLSLVYGWFASIPCMCSSGVRLRLVRAIHRIRESLWLIPSEVTFSGYLCPGDTGFLLKFICQACHSTLGLGPAFGAKMH